MIEIYTDGASQGNPGLSGAGIYIKSTPNNLKYAIPLPVMTNHEAEFHAVILALDICLEQFPDEILSFRSDSQIVVRAMENNYVKNKLFQPLLAQIAEKTSHFSLVFSKWIPSQANNQADRLAQQAIHKDRFS